MKTDEARAFPEYYEKYFAEHMCGVGPNRPAACIGPIAYQGSRPCAPISTTSKPRSAG